MALPVFRVYAGTLPANIREKIENFISENDEYFIETDDFEENRDSITVRNATVLNPETKEKTDVVIKFLDIGKKAIERDENEK